MFSCSQFCRKTTIENIQFSKFQTLISNSYMSRTKLLRVPLLIGHCHHYMEVKINQKIKALFHIKVDPRSKKFIHSLNSCLNLRYFWLNCKSLWEGGIVFFFIELSCLSRLCVESDLSPADTGFPIIKLLFKMTPPIPTVPHFLNTLHTTQVWSVAK